MCGIVGVVDYGGEISEALLQRMRDAIDYRGPDSAGSRIVSREGYAIGLGHRRLSILDLSDLGSQPMRYEHLTIVHNGEVYNFGQIRDDLVAKGYSFISHTDTEVILKAFHAWGAACVERFRGMFAFAIYDTREERLYIFRDRAGVKPLYYHRSDGLFLFGSELKSFYRHPRFQRRIDPKALPYYFRFGYIPAPLTIFADTHKLRAGHYLVVDLPAGSVEEQAYWRVEACFDQPKSTMGEAETIDALEVLLRESFGLRMVSDVPVGVFLSGGVDSSLVTALLQSMHDQPLKTFTIGFAEEGYDEATFAKEIAAYLGTDHTEYYCTTEDMLQVIRELPEMYDEPFGDSSAIPTHLVSRLAKGHVSVVLSGDGGDEAFIGYSKYFALAKIADLQNKRWKKRILKALTSLVPDEAVVRLNALLPASKRQKNIRDKYQKFKNAIEAESMAEMFINASSYVDSETLREVLIDSEVDFGASGFAVCGEAGHLDPLDQMSLCDYKTFMTDDVLTKVDRASMSVSLEAREPLLDHRIIEYAATIPSALKYREGTGKYLLKKVLYRYIPQRLIERPKSGFQVPLYEWLRGDLRDLLDHYLSRERLDRSGIYRTENLLALKEAYYRGESVNLSLLWFVLMYEMWHERWLAEE